MKKKTGLIIGGVAGGLFVIAGLIAGLFFLKGHKNESYRVIKVMKAEGHSYVSRGDITDLEAYEGMALQSGDSVHVDGNSSLVLMMDEDKLAYVEPNTDFSIIAEGTAKDSRSRIELTKGALTCEVQNALGNGSTYEVNTPNSTMAVRSTSFRVEVTDVDTIKKVLESNAIQPSMLFMAKTLESSGRSGLNTITRLTVTDGRVKVTLHDENGNPVGSEYEFDADTDVLIGGNDTDSCIISEITGIDPGTFPQITIEFFLDIANDTAKMIISVSDLNDALDQNKDCSVTFMNGTEVFGMQTVTYGQTATEPGFTPTEKGRWDANFSVPIITDTLIYWIPE